MWCQSPIGLGRVGQELINPRRREIFMADTEPRNILRDKLMTILGGFVEGELPPDVKDETTLKDLGLDSLAHFNFLLAMEEKFGFEIPDHELTFVKMNDIGGLLDVLTEHVAKMDG